MLISCVPGLYLGGNTASKGICIYYMMITNAYLSMSPLSSSYNLTFLREKKSLSYLLCYYYTSALPRNLKRRSLIPTSRHIIFDFCISWVSKTGSKGNSKRALASRPRTSWGHVRGYCFFQEAHWLQLGSTNAERSEKKTDDDLRCVACDANGRRRRRA